MEDKTLLDALVAKLGIEKAQIAYDKIMIIKGKKVKTKK
tara:strand:- start:328 stop:444 length:117 start_codon:yes stop_codon:yes gene_type:complete